MTGPDFLTLADNPVLDFLNTVVVGESGLVDLLGTDSDVLSWFRIMGFLDDDDRTSYMHEVLLRSARSLRDVIRQLVFQKKNGKHVEIETLNSFLIHRRYKITLAHACEGRLEIVREYDKSTPEQLLMEIAHAAAELLAESNFDLVRKCEDPDCNLWFYDKTKGHRRRWCRMTSCGNRHKVASFRTRQRNLKL